MELMILDATTNQPTVMVEGYDSLIWTERFNSIGDFVLTTGDISKFINLLPEGTKLTLRDSRVVMIVETHKIEKKKHATAVMTITGRAYESILDRRVAIRALTGGTLDQWTVYAQKPSDAAYLIILHICVNGGVHTNDIFPSSQVQFTCWDLEPSDGITTYQIKQGSLLAAVLELITTENANNGLVQHGIRSLRPGVSATSVGIDIYLPTDVSSTVVFDTDRMLLEDGTYLFSKVGMANTAYVLGGSKTNTGATINKDMTPASGLNRRVMLVDGSSSDLSISEAVISFGEAALGAASDTAMFDGVINPEISPYIYNVDYNLGDTVMFRGEYGMTRKARVTEYIRTQDATGEKAYPTLSSLGG